MANLTVTAANVAAVSGVNTVRKSGTSGATITQGMALFYEASTERYKIGSNANDGSSQIVGIALSAASAGQPVQLQTGGEINPGATATEGVIYVLTTNGAIAPAADLTTGDYVCVIGIGNADGNIDLILKAFGATTQ